MIICGDARSIPLADGSVQTVITSPPYMNLKNYGHAGQIGLEDTVAGYLDNLIAVLAELWRVLRQDGTVFLNIGDTYANWGGLGAIKYRGLCGIPWRVALAAGGVVTMDAPEFIELLNGLLNGDAETQERARAVIRFWERVCSMGWGIRAENIWRKPNAKPENVRDRTTREHEHVFMLVKETQVPRLWRNEETRVFRYARPKRDEKGWIEYHYYYDDDAVAVASKRVGETGIVQNSGKYRARELTPDDPDFRTGRANKQEHTTREKRNLRTVWDFPTANLRDDHFAPFPLDLVKLCLIAGAPAGGVVLDPFLGSGTVLRAAMDLGRKGIGIEINQKHCEIARRRCAQTVLEFG